MLKKKREHFFLSHFRAQSISRASIDLCLNAWFARLQRRPKLVVLGILWTSTLPSRARDGAVSACLPACLSVYLSIHPSLFDSEGLVATILLPKHVWASSCRQWWGIGITFYCNSTAWDFLLSGILRPLSPDSIHSGPEGVLRLQMLPNRSPTCFGIQKMPTAR